MKINFKILSISVMSIIIIGILAFTSYHMTKLKNSYETSLEQREKEHISALFSLHDQLPSYNQPREIRMKDFTEKAKGAILLEYANYKIKTERQMTNTQIDKFVIKMWELSDARLIDPWIPMAFAKKESNFIPSAISHVKARGLFQFMDYTAKLLLVDRYYNDCEYDPLIALELFFKYWDVLETNIRNEQIEMKIQWVAVGYMCGPYVMNESFSNGNTPTDTLLYVNKYISKNSPPSYASDILEIYRVFKKL